MLRGTGEPSGHTPPVFINMGISWQGVGIYAVLIAKPFAIHAALRDVRQQVPAKAYPESLLPDFRKHFREEWLPNRALEYFQRRDGEALQFLPKLIASNKPKKLN